ncbi:DUF5776 domain-containing protein [Lentilactobacillus parafarraginis]|uniref:DUF5776 domain-containing protein n=1 Tax=Lentilactobacillus parafarraginis TaxID=390842 RepID=UPI0007053F04|nr:DUF5776 domain-containing protein [Lentilactobacillus parafarraginis]
MTVVFFGISFLIGANRASANTTFQDESAALSLLNQKGQAIVNGTTPKVSDSNSTPSSDYSTTYYIDSINGNDNNSGKSPNDAWKTIRRVNSGTDFTNDQILFRAGDYWSDGPTLSPKGHHFKISSYGTGEYPKLAGNGLIQDVIRINNEDHVEISNLDVSNTVSGANGKDGTKLKADLKGIHITGADQGTLSNYYLHDLYVHDVTGTVAWINGSGKAPEGASYQNGWNGSKDSGGIIFDIQTPSRPDSKPTVFRDVTISDNVVNDNSYGGITIKQHEGKADHAWASRDDGTEENGYQSKNWAPHSNITIKNNYIDQSKSDFACDGIYLTSSKDSKIQGNITKGTGTVGIEMYYCDHITVQFNDVSGAVRKAGGGDSAGIDPDRETTNMLVQYNYIHGNGDGILLCGFGYGTSVIRYNVLKDNAVPIPGYQKGQAGIYYVDLFGDSGKHYIYNNDFYNTRQYPKATFIGSAPGMNNTKDHAFVFNNNFFSTQDSPDLNPLVGRRVSYSHNNYFGGPLKPLDGEANALKDDPMFKGQLDTNPQFEDLAALKIANNSPLIGKGTAMELTGLNVAVATEDLFGVPISTNPSIGVSEPMNVAPAGTTPSSTSSSSTPSSSVATPAQSSSTISSSSSISSVPVDKSNRPMAKNRMAPFKVFAREHFYEYRKPTFKVTNRAKKVSKHTILIVVSVTKSANGFRRYQLSNGRFITTNSKFVKRLYFATKVSKLKVINHSGIFSYHSLKFLRQNRMKFYKYGSVLHIRKVVRYGLTTRLKLSNGSYITGNRLFIDHY